MHKIFTGNSQITPYRPWSEERKAAARALIASGYRAIRRGSRVVLTTLARRRFPGWHKQSGIGVVVECCEPGVFLVRFKDSKEPDLVLQEEIQLRPDMRFKKNRSVNGQND